MSSQKNFTIFGGLGLFGLLGLVFLAMGIHNISELDDTEYKRTACELVRESDVMKGKDSYYCKYTIRSDITGNLQSEVVGEATKERCTVFDSSTPGEQTQCNAKFKDGKPIGLTFESKASETGLAFIMPICGLVLFLFATSLMCLAYFCMKGESSLLASDPTADSVPTPDKFGIYLDANPPPLRTHGEGKIP